MHYALVALALALLVALAEAQSCGYPAFPPLESAPKIVGGRVARPNSWPWQISLRVGALQQHICGGSVITPYWILTAAHCVYDNPSPSRYTIHAGRHYTSTDTTGIQRSGVSRVIVHPSYNPNTINNDLALLKLSSPFSMTSHVSPVCLPSSDAYNGQLCFVTGWGETQGTGGSGVLKQAGIKVIDSGTCTQPGWYGSSVNPATMICAGYPNGGHDSCQGDSGGPFVCKNGSQWQLNGIVSWGQGCAQAYKPGVYTRVITYDSWIQYTLATN
jgi:plasminogen